MREKKMVVFLLSMHNTRNIGNCVTNYFGFLWTKRESGKREREEERRKVHQKDKVIAKCQLT